MKRAACIFLALIALSAQSKVIGTTDDGGNRIDLHDERGPCEGDALRAEYVKSNGEVTAGCWISKGPMVYVVFLDADVARIPMQSVRKPVGA